VPRRHRAAVHARARIFRGTKKTTRCTRRRKMMIIIAIVFALAAAIAGFIVGAAALNPRKPRRQGKKIGITEEFVDQILYYQQGVDPPSENWQTEQAEHGGRQRRHLPVLVL
jgi:hypothetical protein